MKLITPEQLYAVANELEERDYDDPHGYAGQDDRQKLKWNRLAHFANQRIADEVAENNKTVTTTINTPVNQEGFIDSVKEMYGDVLLVPGNSYTFTGKGGEQTDS